MKVAYFDCFAGISGDMCLGALVDAGASIEEIGRRLKRLPVRGYRLSSRKVTRAGIAATKVDVQLGASPRRVAGTLWRDIERLIGSSSLSDSLKGKGLSTFRRLFDAEAKVHGKRYTSVHLHETGATDCIVDIFGSVIGLELLGVKEVYASSVNVGGGTVRTANGLLPSPAPATAELLREVPIHSSGHPYEMTTPTGAAILKSLSSGFGPLPPLIPDRIGIGAGGRDIRGMPNVLRILIGESSPLGEDTVTVIETNIDDMNPQLYEHLCERLFDAGALDVTLTQVMMKKMRPGVTLSVLCTLQRRDELIDLILGETTTIGVRYHEAVRVTMDREVKAVKTRYGPIRVKISSREGIESKCVPEYEDCKAIALKTGVPLLRVMEEARQAACGKTFSLPRRRLRRGA